MSDQSAQPTTAEVKNHAAFIWTVAELLRGDYKQSEYGRVILPFVVLRRWDCVLAPVKADMLADYEKVKGKVDNYGAILDRRTQTSGLWNTSKLDLAAVCADPDNVADSLRDYVAGFSDEARDILDKFEFATQVSKLAGNNLLYLVLSKFVEVDLGPEAVSNTEMGYLYEELVRKFSELSNETAGEHFTPREVIRLMVELLFADDDELLTTPGIVKTLYDPACGTGGMLSVAEDHLRRLNPEASLKVFGQELNAETYAICRSDMMLKGQDARNIAYGNSFSEDGHAGERFDYLLANPPFGVEWKKVRDAVESERDELGFAGRFGAGTPRISDGSFLFLQHMISKMRLPEDGGARLAIVFNGSPLFTGAAGSGESEIRRWIIENDWLETVVALPDQLFYNTGISTYVWVVTNRKRADRRGKVQLIDARDQFVKMRKSLGEKRKEISAEQIAAIAQLHDEPSRADADRAATGVAQSPADADLPATDAAVSPTGGAAAATAGGSDASADAPAEQPAPKSKTFPNVEFGFLRITVERPLRQRFEVTDEGVAALRADKKFAKLDEPTQDAILADLGHHLGSSEDDGSLRAVVKTAMKRAEVKGKPLENAIVDAFAVPDPDASITFDSKGRKVPDSDLRDNENVPLAAVASLGAAELVWEPDVAERLASDPYVELVAKYLDDEVLPYVPEAWVDHSKTKIGYEIPLTRHFYVYTPPRPLEAIDAEIRELEAEIQELLGEVTG